MGLRRFVSSYFKTGSFRLVACQQSEKEIITFLIFKVRGYIFYSKQTQFPINYQIFVLLFFLTLHRSYRAVNNYFADPIESKVKYSVEMAHLKNKKMLYSRPKAFVDGISI